MSRNRVIGRNNSIPWHLPADFQWFKRTTMGHVLVMGRKTYLSIGRPLPGRETWVLSRSGFTAPGVRAIRDLAPALDPGDPREIWICGGAEIYRQFLPACDDLFLTVVRRDVEGDAVFPTFEDDFEFVGDVLQDPEFTIRHYRNRRPRPPGGSTSAGAVA